MKPCKQPLPFEFGEEERLLSVTESAGRSERTMAAIDPLQTMRQCQSTSVHPSKWRYHKIGVAAALLYDWIIAVPVGLRSNATAYGVSLR